MSGGYERRGSAISCASGWKTRCVAPWVRRWSPNSATVPKACWKRQSLNFSIDAEMIVYGVTEPSAFVTMGGEPVNLNADGTFTARVPLPDRRQVLPIVASSNDGVEEQTIVLAVERNTKMLEAKIREPGE